MTRNVLPIRELDDPGLPSEIREAIHVARNDGPDAEARSRMRSAFLGVVAPPPIDLGDAVRSGSGRAASSAGAGAVPSVAMSGMLKAILGAFVAATVGWAGSQAWSTPDRDASPRPTRPAVAMLPRATIDEPMPRPSTSDPPPPPDLQAPVEAVPESPTLSMRRPRLRSPNTVATGSASTAPSERSDELTLLHAARRLVSENPAGALTLLREHEMNHPRSSLTQERELMIVECLVRLGERELATKAVEAFVKRYPRSSHRPRIDALRARLDPDPSAAP